MKTKFLTTAAILAFGVSTGAQASLVGMFYDSVNNITWASDANLFQTQAASNANLVNDIISANGGVINDTPNTYDTVPNSGIYSLTSADFNTTTGAMTWWGAQAWANNLTLGGVSGWSLPTTVPGVNGWNQTSQMGNLFYTQLGGVQSSSIATTHNGNYDLFSNVQTSLYWSGSQSASISNNAWVFNFNGGRQTSTTKVFQNFAWAVHSGDVTVAAVPLPAAVWLFLSALMGVLGLKRRKNIA